MPILKKIGLSNGKFGNENDKSPEISFVPFVRRIGGKGG
jgi:hypothetical protein